MRQIACCAGDATLACSAEITIRNLLIDQTSQHAYQLKVPMLRSKAFERQVVCALQQRSASADLCSSEPHAPMQKQCPHCVVSAWSPASMSRRHELQTIPAMASWPCNFDTSLADLSFAAETWQTALCLMRKLVYPGTFADSDSTAAPARLSTLDTTV